MALNRYLPYEWNFSALECAAIESSPVAVALCVNCGLAPRIEGCDDCAPCVAAFLLTDPTQLALLRRLHAGTPWLATLNAEVARQLCAQVACGFMRVRQAS